MIGLGVDEAVEQLGALQRRTLDLFIERRHQRAEGQPTRLQVHVLRAIRERGTLQVSDVAKLLEVTPATTSQLLATMEGKGWLERTLLPHDRRRHQVALTSAGEAVVREVDTRGKLYFARVLAVLSAEERGQLVALAQRLVDVLGQVQVQPPEEGV